MKRLLASLSLGALFILGACQLAPTKEEQPPGSELKYAVCDKALALPSKRRAFQGYDGWFYFEHDLTEHYPFYEQTKFFAELSAKLRAKGTTLVLLPVPGRALIKPETLLLKDMTQAAFDPLEATGAFATFVSTLRSQGVETFDTLEAASAYDKAGGQTFFRRDLHWRSEGANAVFTGLANQIKQLEPALPQFPVTLARSAADNLHHGQFINSWTMDNCGYFLPAEPQGVYTVTPSQKDVSRADVVLVGSSFSIPPYGYDFLASALQSRVFNVAVGSGGVLVSLERYLGSSAFTNYTPSVLVWEFPLFAPVFTAEDQQRILAIF